jgi:site-specific recombinase
MPKNAVFTPFFWLFSGCFLGFFQNLEKFSKKMQKMRKNNTLKSIGYTKPAEFAVKPAEFAVNPAEFAVAFYKQFF